MHLLTPGPITKGKEYIFTFTPDNKGVARPYSAPRERVWDMAIEQFVAPYRGVRTNHSTVFSHMTPEVYD